jgi:hypothetical protein
VIPVTVRAPAPISSPVDAHVDAFARLCQQHAEPARDLARALLEHHRRGDGSPPTPRDVDGLVGLAAAQLWPAVDAGEVDESVVGLHLLAAVRRVATPGAGPSPVAHALASLPPAAQWELWHVEVEHRPVTSPALLREAHAALPDALVAAHAGTTRRARCLVARTQLPAYARSELDAEVAARVGAHLSVCRPCSTLALDLLEARTAPGELLARIFLGAGAGAYLAAVAPPSAPADDLVRTVGRVAGGGVIAAVLAAAFTLGAGALDSTGPGDDGRVAEARVASRPPSDGPTSRAVVEAALAAAPEVRPGVQPVAEVVTSDPTQPVAPTATTTTPPDHAPTQDPTQEPTHAPSHHPTETPTQAPSQTPSQAPSQAPSQTPTPPTDQPVLARDPSAVDVAVRAAVSGIGPASVLTVGVDRLAEDQSATVTIEGDGPLASVQLGPGCRLLGLGTATCEVTGSRTITLVGAPLGQQLLDGLTSTLTAPLTGGPGAALGTLRVTVVPSGGLHDTSTADNSTSVALGGRV